MNACWTGWSRPPSGSPSTVMTGPSTADTGRSQDERARSPMSTKHAPHSPIPQPNLGPAKPRSWRSTSSNGVSGSQVTRRSAPLTVSRNSASLIVSSSTQAGPRQCRRCSSFSRRSVRTIPTIAVAVSWRAWMRSKLAAIQVNGCHLISVIRGPVRAADSALSPWCGGREQAQGAGAVHRSMAVVDAELGVQVTHVSADGVDREEQLIGDLGSGEVGRQVAQHPDLAVGELFIQAAAAGPSRLAAGRRREPVPGEQVLDLGDQGRVGGAVPGVALEQTRRWVQQEDC